MKKVVRLLFSVSLAAAAVSCQEKENAGGGGKTTPAVIEVTSLSLDREELTLYTSDTLTIHATVLPENAEDKTVLWASSNRGVADVNDGLVTAYREGTAVITAKAGKRVSSCLVIVLKSLIHVESISLNKLQTTVEQGCSDTLTVTLSPADTDFPQVSWSSSDETVAVVSDGVVTAVAEGTAVITATADGKSCSCTVTVPHVPILVAEITLNKTELLLEQGDSETLVATVQPADAEFDSIVWSSSAPAVATVENGLVKAVGIGDAVITVTAGGKSASCQVKVSEKLTVIGGNIEDLDETQPPIDD